MSEYDARLEKLAAKMRAQLIDINFQDREGNTYLHKACYKKENDKARVLLIKGIDFEIKNNLGLTALDICNKLHNKQLITTLRIYTFNKSSKRAL
jgi:ankyrin repeat protein